MSNRLNKDPVHGFSIPHDKARCIGDAITVEVPQPPKYAGSLEVPQQYRDMIQHNVVCGKIVKMGPLAFVYQDADGMAKREAVREGDWVTFRPFAGTMIQPDGKVGAVGGIRYLSSFRDVLATYAAEDMMEAEAHLKAQKQAELDEEAERERANTEQRKSAFDPWGGQSREKVVFPPAKPEEAA